MSSQSKKSTKAGVPQREVDVRASSASANPGELKESVVTRNVTAAQLMDTFPSPTRKPLPFNAKPVDAKPPTNKTPK